MQKTLSGPYIHTEIGYNSRATEWLVALSPVLVWSVFMFGARVITLCFVTAMLSAGIDYFVARYLFKRPYGARFDVMTAVYGVLTAFMMPVAVSFYIPVLASVLIVFAKNLRVSRKKMLFNPFVFAAAVLNLICGEQMTSFTRPFAYFSAFDFKIDPRLLEGYRVISPLQYMADGSVYEDGVIAQLYGYASGCMGEIATVAIAVGLLWLCIRKEADWGATFCFLVPVLLLALLYPSDDAETNYYAFSVLFSGAIIFLSAFAMNEANTVPITKTGRYIFGLVAGTLTFVLRKTSGGFEWGYFVILGLNVISPFIEMLTKPKALSKVSDEKRRNND